MGISLSDRAPYEPVQKHKPFAGDGTAFMRSAASCSVLQYVVNPTPGKADHPDVSPSLIHIPLQQEQSLVKNKTDVL